MSDHRWSGWPGAWCLDCGIEDPRETCVANPGCACAAAMESDKAPAAGTCKVEIPPCPCPGSGQHDPYRPREGA